MTEMAPNQKMKNLWIASDHAGFGLKTKLLEAHPELPWSDLGPFDEARVDYPDFAQTLCNKITSDNEFGVLICGSGQGMAMKANKNLHIRAALCWSAEVAELARAHNNANVLCLGARVMSPRDCENILTKFLATAFEGGRHQHRVDKLSEKP